MRIILGPCRCLGCGRLVWWAFPRHYSPGDLYKRRWRNDDGKPHRCAVQ